MLWHGLCSLFSFHLCPGKWEFIPARCILCNKVVFYYHLYIQILVVKNNTLLFDQYYNSAQSSLIHVGLLCPIQTLFRSHENTFFKIAVSSRPCNLNTSRQWEWRSMAILTLLMKIFPLCGWYKQNENGPLKITGASTTQQDIEVCPHKSHTRDVFKETNI